MIKIDKIKEKISELDVVTDEEIKMLWDISFILKIRLIDILDNINPGYKEIESPIIGSMITATDLLWNKIRDNVPYKSNGVMQTIVTTLIYKIYKISKDDLDQHKSKKEQKIINLIEKSVDYQTMMSKLVNSYYDLFDDIVFNKNYDMLKNNPDKYIK